jgi:serine/threonine protein kinase/Tol biopolymer transport system component
MVLSVGTRLGPYEIQSLLGAGGMGEVYKGRDTRLDRTVAIKILPEALAADPQFRERFDREARTISRLDHPHICALYDIGEQDGRAYLVMQHLEGETLELRLERGPLPLNEALIYATQIAEALATAHRVGIVHRDLKPGNVMLTKAGTKLLDFGLAKASAGAIGAGGGSILPTTPPHLTAQGTILGTFQYMAPEQAEGQDANARTDIFAFGCVLYEMLTGQKAFEGKTQAGLIGAIMHAEPAPVAARQPLVPRALDRVLRKCLAKDPDARWQTARDLHDELTWIADESVSSSPPTPFPASVFRPRERVAWLLAAVALTAVVAGAVWELRRSPVHLSVMRFEVPTPASSDLTSFALSPDGDALVFVAAADGAAKLWVRRLDHTTAIPLAGTEGASFPFWSPDGHAIGFFADSKLKRVDVAGGTPQVLAEAPNGRGGTWSDDGVILFSPTNTAVPRTVLMRVSAAGGTATPATRLAAGQVNHRWPQFLPDGRRFLFLSAFGPPDANGVYLGSLDGREPIRLLPTESAALFAPPNTLLVVRQRVLRAMQFDPDRGTSGGEDVPVADAVGTDETLLRSALSVSRTGVLAYRPTGGGQRRQLVWVDRTGAQLEPIGPPDDNALGDPGIDPSGRRLVVSRFLGGKGDVWLMDPHRGAATRLTFDPALATNPTWSADGRRVFFLSTRGGGTSLFEKPVAGPGGEQLILRDGGMPLSASPDGRFVLYTRTGSSTGNDVWALPLAGDDRKPFPVLQTTADERAAEFSPDGRWIAYESNESGRFEIYIRSFPAAGETLEVSTTGGTQPQWRHDEKELYYIALDARLMAVSVTASPDGQTLYAGAPVPLFPTRLASGVGLAPGRLQYAVAADGRFLLNTVVGELSAPPITLVLNWTAQARQ